MHGQTRRLTSGCTVDAAESDLPLSLSPKCSVVDFSESGCAVSKTRHHTTPDDQYEWYTYLEGSAHLVGETLAAGVGHGYVRVE